MGITIWLMFSRPHLLCVRELGVRSDGGPVFFAEGLGLLVRQLVPPFGRTQVEHAHLLVWRQQEVNPLLSWPVTR